MLDSDLAEIYGYETKNFNRQVKNNIEKFPDDMMFQLTLEEVENVSRCKNFTSIMQTSGMKGGRVYLPYVFTEQGIYMLMTVLKGELETKQSIALVRMFKQMRQYISENSSIFQRLDRIELKQLESDKKFEQIFKQLEAPREKKAVIYSAGQLWDAVSFIEDILKKAGKSIILIDKYVDNHTLNILSKKKKGVSALIVTDKGHCKLTEDEITLFKKQYGELKVKYYSKIHDRYIILDEKTLYHCGASIKDAGKQVFSIDIIDEPDVLEFLKNATNNI